MSKPLKFYQTLNRTPRSAKHGKHRRPSPPAYGDPVARTDHRARGASPIYSLAWNTGNWTVNDAASFDPFRKPEPPTIPYAGIRTGELIGHRLWWVIDGRLCSLAHKRMWLPGEVISADTNEIVSHDLFFLQVIWGGTYAFSDPASLGAEIESHLNHIAEWRARREDWLGTIICSHPVATANCVVSGTIKMWGDVVEHETGYRAQFAKLNSIDAIHGGSEADLDFLRQHYGVPAVGDRTEREPAQGSA